MGTDIERWRTDVLQPLVQGNAVTPENARLLGGIALLSADTDKVKQYVFESDKLPEIRGASALLRQLNESDSDQSLRGLFTAQGLSPAYIDAEPCGCLVYAGGGSLLALVPVDLAETLKRRIEALYPQTTDVATITAVWAPFESTVLQQHFNQAVRQMQYRLQRAKEQRAYVPTFEAVAQARRCRSCGVRPASDKDPRIGQERWLCQACFRKIKEGRAEKADYVNDFEAWLEGQGTLKAQYHPQAASALAASDLTEIGQAQTGELIGLIYADGNGIGEHLFDAPSPTAFRQRSHALRDAVRTAVFRALAEHTQVARVNRTSADDASDEKQAVLVHPWEIVVLGGDDVLVFVPGAAALAVALALCDYFPQALSASAWAGPAPQMSAGVVIAHASNPVRFMRELAEQLLQSAKARAHDEAKRTGQGTGAVDFLVLKSQSMTATDVTTLRNTVYRKDFTEREELSFTGRPFSLPEMRDLLSQARLLRDTGFPRAQLQLVRVELYKTERMGRPWPALFYRRQEVRLPAEWRAVLKVIEEDWQQRTENHDFYPWLTRPPHADRTRAYAVWEDLVEVRALLLPDERLSATATALVDTLKERVARTQQRLRADKDNHDED